MYRLETAKSVDKFLEKCDGKLRKRVLDAFEMMEESPFDETLDIKPLVNKKGTLGLGFQNMGFCLGYLKKRFWCMSIKPTAEERRTNEPKSTP